MEEINRFPLLRLNLPTLLSPSSSPRKRDPEEGKRENSEKSLGNAINRIVRIWIPAFSGMTESGLR
jgi:hypothetical protein